MPTRPWISRRRSLRRRAIKKFHKPVDWVNGVLYFIKKVKGRQMILDRVPNTPEVHKPRH
ncbi:hypothetical protein IT411_00850 [Candidatus Peregrinibacteria bacterium]|nr:hypothetical protein [Candidatus Peregrinibacteria bacterium]